MPMRCDTSSCHAGSSSRCSAATPGARCASVAAYWLVVGGRVGLADVVVLEVAAPGVVFQRDAQGARSRARVRGRDGTRRRCRSRGDRASSSMHERADHVGRVLLARDARLGVDAERPGGLLVVPLAHVLGERVGAGLRLGAVARVARQLVHLHVGELRSSPALSGLDERRCRRRGRTRCTTAEIVCAAVVGVSGVGGSRRAREPSPSRRGWCRGRSGSRGPCARRRPAAASGMKPYQRTAESVSIAYRPAGLWGQLMPLHVPGSKREFESHVSRPLSCGGKRVSARVPRPEAGDVGEGRIASPPREELVARVEPDGVTAERRRGGECARTRTRTGRPR